MPVLVNPSRFTISAPVGYDATVLSYSPLLYLKCDETSGTTAADSSGNGRNATINGTPALGQTTVMPSGSGSFLLNANAKYLRVPNGSWMNTTTWTVDAWIRFATLGSSYQNIVNRDGDSTHRGWNFYARSLKLNAFVAASGNPTDHLGATSLSATTNYYVAMTSDGTTVKVYLNGVLDGTFTTAVGVNSANDLLVAASQAGLNSPNPPALTMSGFVDHVAYYGTALSGTDIATIYASA